MHVTILDPLADPNWDDLLTTLGNTTFFHTAAWARVIHEAYGYKVLYFAGLNERRLVGIIPIMEVRSFITGNRGVCIPFTDICDPLAENQAILNTLLDSVIAYGKGALWKYVEIRGGAAYFDESLCCAAYYVHVLDLMTDMKDLLKSFRDSTRRNILKAEKEGVNVIFSTSPSSVETFYLLHCETRRTHGLPPQPWTFFKKLHEHVISKGIGLVALASHQGDHVAGGIYLLWGNQVIYKFGASRQRHAYLRANNLVMWEAIRHFRCNGFSTLHFGRTDQDDRGLLQFKRGWRPAERVRRYYRINFNGNAVRSKKRPSHVLLYLNKILPLSALRVVGRLLYRHMG